MGFVDDFQSLFSGQEHIFSMQLFDHFPNLHLEYKWLDWTYCLEKGYFEFAQSFYI